MPTLIEQIDAAANLARWQAQEFRNLAAAEDDEPKGKHILSWVAPLCNTATELCSLSMTHATRRRALAKLLLQTDAAAEVLDELQWNREVGLVQ